MTVARWTIEDTHDHRVWYACLRETCILAKVVVRSGTLEMCCGILEAKYAIMKFRREREWSGEKKGAKKLGGGFSVE